MGGVQREPESKSENITGMSWKKEASRVKSERVRENKGTRNDVLTMLRLNYNDVIGDGDGDVDKRELQRDREAGYALDL